MHFVYLASSSPRRRELLEQIGVSYQLLMPASEDVAAHAALESLEAVRPAEAAVDYVQRITQLKLDAARQRWQAASGALAVAPIVCADTTVSLDGCILGKPTDAQDARAMLQALSGRRHEVLTAVALAVPQRLGDGAAAGREAVPQAGDDGRWVSDVVVSRSQVWCMPLSLQQVQAYIDAGQWQGKAGGYAIQGTAGAWIERIDGSYSGIMGLPLFETAELLRKHCAWVI